MGKAETSKSATLSTSSRKPRTQAEGILINIARGTANDEQALLAALEAKSTRGAGLDVFLNEPRIDPRFAVLDNVVLQPHVGSATIETRKAMGQLVRYKLAARFAGHPLLSPVA